MPDEIRYQKFILKKGKDLRLGGSPIELEQLLKTHFLSNPQDAADLPADLPAQVSTEDLPADPPAQLDEDSSLPKHPCLERAEDTDDTPFSFTGQGEWVAVYFDQQFYVGQVIDVHSSSEATVQYLEQTKCRKDYFRYPQSEDVARTKAHFVFDWKLDVVPISNDFRVWKVSNIDIICDDYLRLKLKGMAVL